MCSPIGALTYLYQAAPASGMAVMQAGKVYTPNAQGITTGVAAADAFTLQAVTVARCNCYWRPTRPIDQPAPAAGSGTHRRDEQPQPVPCKRDGLLAQDIILRLTSGSGGESPLHSGRSSPSIALM